MSKKIRNSTQVHKAQGRREGDINTISLKRLEIKTCFRSGYVQTFLSNRSSEIRENNFKSISIISSISLMEFTDASYESLAKSKKLTSHLHTVWLFDSFTIFMLPVMFPVFYITVMETETWTYEKAQLFSTNTFSINTFSPNTSSLITLKLLVWS